MSEGQSSFFFSGIYYGHVLQGFLAFDFFFCGWKKSNSDVSMLTRHPSRKSATNLPGFTLPLRVDKMRGYLVASTQRWASCMAHAKVPVRASVSKFPACAVGGVDAKAERSTSGKFHFISRFFPDDLLAGMLRAEHAGSNLFGDDAILVISFFPGTSRPPPASWREDTRSSHRCPRRKSDIL